MSSYPNLFSMSNQKNTLLPLLSGGALLGGGLLALDAFVLERHLFRVRYHVLGEATSEVQPLRMVQISDVHLRKVNRRHRRIAQKVNELDPDLLFFTGDFIDTAEDMSEVEKLLSLFNRKATRLAVLGNWEYKNPLKIEDLRLAYHRQGCTLLVNRSLAYVHQGRKLLITGLDDLIEGQPNLAQALLGTDYPQKDAHLVLSHCPAYRDQIHEAMQKDPNLKIDYVFSGHTHGGQVKLGDYIPILPKGSGKYIQGFYNDKKPILYVSAGLGTSQYKIRFGVRAEINVFDYFLP